MTPRSSRPVTSWKTKTDACIVAVSTVSEHQPITTHCDSVRVKVRRYSGQTPSVTLNQTESQTAFAPRRYTERPCPPLPRVKSILFSSILLDCELVVVDLSTSLRVFFGDEAVRTDAHTS